MGEGEQNTALETIFRTVSLSLSPYGGRVFAHNATADNLNRSTIELKCWWHDITTMFDLSVAIGDEKHEVPRDQYDDDSEFGDNEDGKVREEEIGWRLSNCPIMLSIYEVDEAWFTSSAEANGGDPLLGQFIYHPPLKTADGVVNDKRPMITAWIGMGAENFGLVRDRLISGGRSDFDVGISVVFPDEAVESGWVGRKVEWDGNEPLRITEATVVWKRHDWDSHYDQKREVDLPRELESERVISREHTEVIQATSRLETAIARLATPLWLAVGAIIVALIARRW